MRLVGPLPADTAFLPAKLHGFDAVLAMYHDQGLPVLKYSGFEQAVNLTLGLPYPRVAVDHGTALDLAGKGLADPSSLFAAADTCARMRRVVSAAALHARMSTSDHARASPSPRRSTSASTSCTTRGIIDKIVLAVDPQAGRPPGRDRPRPGRDHLPAARPPWRADRRSSSTAT